MFYHIEVFDEPIHDKGARRIGMRAIAPGMGLRETIPERRVEVAEIVSDQDLIERGADYLELRMEALSRMFGYALLKKILGNQEVEQ